MSASDRLQLKPLLRPASRSLYARAEVEETRPPWTSPAPPESVRRPRERLSPLRASVSVTGLSWRKPDGAPLFHDLDLAFGPERTGLVGRNGVGKSTLLRLIAGELIPTAGRVQTSGALALMPQEPPERPGATVADLFAAGPALALLDRAEAGQASADELASADWSLPGRIEAALLRCGLPIDPWTPLATLSGGQRSRTALAALVFAGPDFLLLDEPTNNLDRDGRAAVLALLRDWKGGAVVVSHDRELLEEMDAIVEITTRRATRYGGGYAAFRASKAAEIAAARRDLAAAEAARAEAARRAQEAAERKARKDGAGRRAAHRLRAAREAAAETALSAARERVEILPPIRMGVPPTGLPPGKRVLRLRGLTGGYDPARPVIRDLSLDVTGPERIAVTGPNGSGKSTLLKLATGRLQPFAGEAEAMVPVAVLDQRSSLPDPGGALVANLMRLDPSMDAGAAHAALAAFGFRAADAQRRAAEFSAGERLRAALACAMHARPAPGLLVLDEPTNHLDLDGIAALEAALSAWDGALLVVSHDAAFLAAVAPDRVIELGG